MALIVCPECKRSVSSSAKVCPGCGYTLKRSFLSYFINKKVIISAIVVALAVTIGLHFFNGLDKYETIALKDCKTLKGMLKNPDSFSLYDDIFIYTKDSKTYGDLVYIYYGGTNSYGGMVKDLAIFRDGTTYYGDYDDDEDDFDTKHEYNQFMLATLPYYYDIVLNDNYENFIRIDSDKIMAHMK